MKLLNGAQAFVDIAKLRDYCLNAAHPRGRHKARVFAAALGLTANESHLLQQALLEAARTSEADLGGQDSYGQRYSVDFMMNGPTGSSMVRSMWIIRQGENYPRLTSCYVL